jgi:hypothetical protein
MKPELDPKNRISESIVDVTLPSFVIDSRITNNDPLDKVILAPLSIFKENISAPLIDVRIGYLGAPLNILTSRVELGIILELQFPVVFQSVLTAPVQLNVGGGGGGNTKTFTVPAALVQPLTVAVTL